MAVHPLPRRLLAEYLGSAFLAALVIGLLLRERRRDGGGPVPGFVAAQLGGGLVAILVIRALYHDVTSKDAAQVVMPHDGAVELDGVQA
jgi:hypothetical protein